MSVNNIDEFVTCADQLIDIHENNEEDVDFAMVRQTIIFLTQYGDSSHKTKIDRLNNILSTTNGQNPIYPEKENFSSMSVPVAPESL
tara:strand:- start:1971 stop:2231 length:261 start_codon:yes stop_codon:yes gene_type:complete